MSFVFTCHVEFQETQPSKNEPDPRGPGLYEKIKLQSSNYCWYEHL